MNAEERAGLSAAIAGFALFSIGDTITKSMAGDWSPIADSAFFFCGAKERAGLYRSARCSNSRAERASDWPP